VLGLQQALGVSHRAHRLHSQPHAHERQLEQLADVGLVVDNQDRALDGAGSPVSAPIRYGSCHVILKSAPEPRPDSRDSRRWPRTAPRRCRAEPGPARERGEKRLEQLYLQGLRYSFASSITCILRDLLGAKPLCARYQ